MNGDSDKSRRDFLWKSSLVTAGAIVVPSIVPASAIGRNAPSNRINIGMIGTGRQAINANLKNGFLKLGKCRPQFPAEFPIIR